MISQIISDYKLMAHKRTNLETVLSSNNKATLAVAKTMLNDTSIEYVTVDNSNGIGTVDIQVSSDDVMKARQILHDLEEVDF